MEGAYNITPRVVLLHNDEIPSADYARSIMSYLFCVATGIPRQELALGAVSYARELYSYSEWVSCPVDLEKVLVNISHTRYS